MKLNNKRTILVGLAFMSISAFWQVYDGIIPLILKNTFNVNEVFGRCGDGVRQCAGAFSAAGVRLAE